MKNCKECGCSFPVTKEYFYAHGGMRDGFLNFCITCYKQKAKDRLDKNPGLNRERCKDNYNRNKKSILSAQKEKYYEDHDKSKQLCREYREKNKEKINIQKRAYRARHKDEIAKKDRIYKKSEQGQKKKKEWTESNRDAIRMWTRKYNKERRENDPNYKLLTNIRTRINRALTSNFKKGNTIKLIGCSIEQLKRHIEGMFRDGMTWDNHTIDGWHLDHIMPCSSFDLSTVSGQKKCFHWSNLQPLWAWENLKKHAKIPEYNNCEEGQCTLTF